MKKGIFASILILSLVFVGCSYSIETEKTGEGVLVAKRELYADIYLCDDVYRTDETLTYGNGTVSFTVGSDVFDICDFKLLLCDDGCERADVVSRASQGYAPAYEVVETHMISGKHPVFKYKMEVPPGMIDSLKAGGAYEKVTEDINSSYHYLVKLEENLYAYICLERKAEAKKYENEKELADECVAKAFFDLNTGRDVIPFREQHLYAVAYLGYNTDGNIPDYTFYERSFLDSAVIPSHHVSGGEYYLIIPRYEGMEMKLYKNSFDSDTPSLMFESSGAEPFIVCCNISDIFSDVTVEFSYQGETVFFSPYISLKDGSVMAGERGLDLTR